MMVSSAGIVYGSILTAVPQGALCESACALIFMAGNEYYWSDGVTAHRGFGGLTRLLHPNAKLGFHQPSIIVPDRNFTKDDTEKIFSLGIKSAEILVSLKSKYPNFMNLKNNAKITVLSCKYMQLMKIILQSLSIPIRILHSTQIKLFLGSLACICHSCLQKHWQKEIISKN